MTRRCAFSANILRWRLGASAQSASRRLVKNLGGVLSGPTHGLSGKTSGRSFRPKILRYPANDLQEHQKAYLCSPAPSGGGPAGASGSLVMSFSICCSCGEKRDFKSGDSSVC